MFLIRAEKQINFTALVLLVLAIVISGCQPVENETNSAKQISTESNPQKLENDSTPDSADPVEEKTTSAELPSLSRGEISAQIASWEQLQQFVASQKGKIVVVDIWSTWCLPCVREYPQLVSLQKKYPKKVVCVSFNINYDGSENNPPESNADELLDFYVKQNSKIRNFISSTPDEELYQKLKLASIPVAYLYDQNGTLVKRFDNDKKEYGDEGFSYEKDIIPMIKQLLKQAAQ